MKSLFLMLFGCLYFGSLSAQTLSGNLKQLSKQPIRLEGFNGLKTYLISATETDEKGSFKLAYAASDYGVGYLLSADNKPLFVILNGEDIELLGEALSAIETIKITKGIENQRFEQYAKEYPKREQAMSAWTYLEKMYTADSLFQLQKTPANAILKEKKRLLAEDTAFLAALPKDSYVSWYLPTRKLVSSVATVAKSRTEAIPETIKAFRNLDYTDPRLYKSGLFKEAIESHFWLLENSGRSLDQVFEEMKISIDALMVTLITNEKIVNETTDYLFDLLEKHSLFEASEYLALKVLNESSCTINNDLARQLETYRAMKKGNTAPEINFNASFFANQAHTLQKLTDLDAKYTVVVFGASWCPKCNEELPELVQLYPKWKSKAVEVVFIALEDNQTAFLNFAKTFPFPSYSDLTKWESTIVNNYYVFSTPTMFLLDQNRKIILRPNSVKQMDAWVDWYVQ